MYSFKIVLTEYIKEKTEEHIVQGSKKPYDKKCKKIFLLKKENLYDK